MTRKLKAFKYDAHNRVYSDKMSPTLTCRQFTSFIEVEDNENDRS